MGAKVTFDTSVKEIIVTQAPDVNGFIDLNVQVDIYSDGKEDWVATPSLRPFTFPVQPIGGVTTADGKQGTLYILLSPWKLRLYDADHELRLDGVLRTDDGSRVWLAPATPRTIAVTPLSPSDVVFLAPDAAALADAVWDETAADHVSAGSAGEALEDARKNARRAFQVGAGGL